MKKYAIKGFIFFIVFTLTSGVGYAQWSKDNVQEEQFRPNGDSIPASGGVILGEYISGEMNILGGEQENELVAKVRAYRAIGVLGVPQSNKRDIKSYLFCMFFKDNPTLFELSDKEREKLFIPDADQACKEISGSGIVRYTVPDHASYVIFTLAPQKITGKIPQDTYLGWYWTHYLLFEKCGVGPFMGRLVEFSVKREYRADAVKAAERDEGIEHIDCPDCNGKGKVLIPEAEAVCPVCDGKGYYFSRGKTGMRRECKGVFGRCEGTGKVTNPARWEDCKKCRGTGKVAKE